MCLESKIFETEPELKLPCANFINLQCSLISCRALLSGSQMLSNCPPCPPQGKTGNWHQYPSQMNKHSPFPHSPALWPGRKVIAEVTGELGTGHISPSARTAQHSPWHCCTPAKIHRSSGADGPVYPTLSLEEGLGWPRNI